MRSTPAEKIAPLARVELEVRVVGRPSSSMDRDVPGVYAVSVNAEVPEYLRADAALDAFHDTLPIKILDDFDISVWRGDTPLVTAEGHGAYALKGEARLEGKVRGPRRHRSRP